MVAATLTRRTRQKKAEADSMADTVRQLGGIPLDRILMHPAPGTATEEDVVALQEAANKRLCELVDGVLVEKAMGFYESRLAAVLVYFIESFLEKHDVGFVLGPGGLIRFFKGLVRLPDVAFFPWRLFPNRLLPRDKVLLVIPELAVEILSESNTPQEMSRKYKEYFEAGVKLVWEIVPKHEPPESTLHQMISRSCGRVTALMTPTCFPDFAWSLASSSTALANGNPSHATARGGRKRANRHAIPPPSLSFRPHTMSLDDPHDSNSR